MPAQAPVPQVEIRLIGEPEVVVDGRARPLPASRKTRALLGYLVRTGRPQRRERLCELLWDGPDDPRAALRWSLAKLRPLVDVGNTARLIADRERVGFECRGADVDVVALNALRDGEWTNASTAVLLAALSRFRGPFLEGLDLSSCPAFHAWCVAEREASRALHVSLLTTLMDRQRSEPARAIAHARALIALDPLAESPRLHLLDLLTAIGDTRRALDEYADYARTLRRELGVKPSLEIERRRMALTRSPVSGELLDEDAPYVGSTRPPPGSPESPFGASPTPAPSEEPTPRSIRVPFVGRERERAVLRELLDNIGKGPSVLLAFGEPGIGKSRLLEELSDMARTRGGIALAGRAFEAELVRPYGAFIDALRGGRGSLEADAEALAPFLSPAAVSAVADRTRLYDGVQGILAKTAAQRSPVVLTLDDLHWFDEATCELLHYIARALRGMPVVIASSVREGELADNVPAQRLLRALARERLSTAVQLGPMAEGELRLLVRGSDREPALGRALQECGGNPLFALEAARALSAGNADLLGSLSRIIAERLSRLQDTDRAVLSWAGALGRNFDVDVLARVTGLAPPELLGSLERLEQHAILRSNESGYDFAHDLLRQAAYRQMSGPRRRLVHAQVARALAATPDPDGTVAGDIAHHAALAGDGRLAASACITAARRCVRLFASRDARELAQRGIQLASTLADSERVPLLVELVAIHVLAEEHADVQGQLTALAEEARRLGLATVEARAHFLRSVLQFRSGDSQAALESSLSRIQAARAASPPELGAELAGAARCYLLLEQNVDVAAQFLAQARPILGPESDNLDLVWAEGMLAHLNGDVDAAFDRATLALSLARRQHAHWEECECLVTLACLALDRAEMPRVLARAADLATVSEKLGESAYGAAAATLSALAHLATRSAGRFAELDEHLGQVRAADANRLLAILSNTAAQLALDAGDLERAAAYAEAALAAAERVQRVNEIALSRAVLARIALARRHWEAAERHLAVATGDGLAVHHLSARSSQYLAHAREMLARRTD